MPHVANQPYRLGGVSYQTGQFIPEAVVQKHKLQNVTGAADLKQETKGTLPGDFPHASYLNEDGRFATPEAVAAASDEELDSVKGLSGARIADIRSYLDRSDSE